MKIIKSDVVPAEYDAFWNETESVIKDAVPSRPVLIIVNTMQPGEDAQLQKMLQACTLAPDKYNIVQLADEQKVAWHRLHEQLQPKFIFLIGVNPAQLGISAMFRLSEPNNFNECIWLPTLSLAELDKNAEAKKHLWGNGMKPMFVDKKYGDF